MKAVVQIKYGDAHSSFEIRELPDPEPGEGQVCIEAEAFGINFSDIWARKGQYKAAPKPPSIIGYEAVGRISKIGKGVTSIKVGTRVIAFVRFGAYAQKFITGEMAVVPIPEDMDPGVAAALGAQYCTAWYAVEECVNIHPGDKILVQAAAGGLGTGVVQIAKRRGAIIFGTAGSDEKLEYLKKIGVDHPINYNKEDYVSVIRKNVGNRGLNFVFDSLGGKDFKKGYRLLGAGGKIVGNGATSRGNGIFGTLKLVFGFGFYNSAFLLMKSKGMIGVNMLTIADDYPEVLRRCIENVVDLTVKGELNPVSEKSFSVSQIAEAHEWVEGRKSVGKVIVKWGK